MEKKKKLPIAQIVFLLGIIIVQVVFFSRNYSIINEKPSEKWDKAVTISQGNVSATLEVVEMDDYIMVIHRDGAKIKVIKTSKAGEVLGENFYDIGKESKQIYLLNNEQDVYLAWTNYENSKRTVKIGRIDEELNIVEVDEYEKYSKLKTVSQNKVIISNSDGDTAIYQVGKGLIIEDQIANSKYTAAAENDGKIYINYYDKVKLKHMVRVYEEGKLIEENLYYEVIYGSNDNLVGVSFIVNDEDMNLVYEMYSKGNSKGLETVSLNRETNEISKNEISYYGYRIGSIEKSGENIYTGTIYHLKDGRETFRDGIEFKIKGGEMSDANIISNTERDTLFASAKENYAVFADYDSYNNLSVKLTAGENVLKYDEKAQKKHEMGYAMSITTKGFGNTIVNLFTVGWAWLMPVLIALGVMFWIDTKLSGTVRGIALGVIAVICTYLQYDTVSRWVNTGVGILPSFLNLTNVTILIVLSMVLITATTYKKYMNKEEAVPMASFAGKIALQAIFILSIFVPYMIRL